MSSGPLVCAVSRVAARRKTSVPEREDGSERQFTSRLGHVCEIGQGQISEAPEVGGQRQSGQA